MLIVFLLICFLVPHEIALGGWDHRGQVGMFTRVFADDDDPTTDEHEFGVLSQLEVRLKERPWFLKLDVAGRSYADPEHSSPAQLNEAYVGFRQGSLRIHVGAQILDWSATEAFHPADVVNSRNLDSRLQDPEKLGEPMIQISTRVSDVTLRLLMMPLVISPQIPDSKSRMSPLPQGVAVGQARWLRQDGVFLEGDRAPQGALVIENQMGDGDFHLHYLRHFNRSMPTTTFDLRTQELRLIYHEVDQLGLTVQYVFGDVVAKLEAADRRFGDDSPADMPGFEGPPDHQVVALGFDYGFNQEDGSDSTFIIEGQSVLGVEKDQRAAIDLFQRDLLVAYRWSLNDVDSQEFLASVIVDMEGREESLYSIQYKTRLGQMWTLEASGRVVDAVPSPEGPSGLEIYHKSNLIELSLRRHF